MPKCDHCGTMILFGGERGGDYRYCNAKCKENDSLRPIDEAIPDEELQELIWQVLRGPRPPCLAGNADDYSSEEVDPSRSGNSTS